jgi:hypothetical protein
MQVGFIFTGDTHTNPGPPTAGGLTMRRRISRCCIASGNGPFDRAKISCAFAVIKAVYGISGGATRPIPDLGTPAVVSDKYRFAFCGIPKVGTKSVSAALFSSPEVATFFIDRCAIAAGAPYKLHYKFSFVRNPWSRVVSCYRDKIQILRPTPLGKLSIMARHRGLAPDLSFDDFVQWLCSPEGSDQYADRHWMSQHKFVCNDSGCIFCDFIGRLEDIESDFQAVCRTIGLPSLVLPHRNRSRQAYRYRDLYNERTMKLVGQRYARDIEMFGYRF